MIGHTQLPDKAPVDFAPSAGELGKRFRECLWKVKCNSDFQKLPTRINMYVKYTNKGWPPGYYRMYKLSH